jgi:hypothetical protein
MAGMAQNLLADARYNGMVMKVTEVLAAISALDPSVMLTTSEAAIFLRTSVTKLERLRKEGGGPIYSQGGGVKAAGTNQMCLYKKAHLIAWLEGNQVSDSTQAAIRKGQKFATIFDLAEHEAFYLDKQGNVESMVEENLLGTVVERIGHWDILWMTPVEAASRRWTDLSRHRDFAESVQDVLTKSLRGVQNGIDSTDVATAALEASIQGAKPRA